MNFLEDMLAKQINSTIPELFKSLEGCAPETTFDFDFKVEGLEVGLRLDDNEIEITIKKDRRKN